MTVKDYITQKFQTFGINLSEADLLDISLEPDDEMTSGNINPVNVGIARFIPSLLLRATSQSVNENGFSISSSWNIEGIKDYYSYLTKKYGLEDELNTDKPKVRFL